METANYWSILTSHLIFLSMIRSVVFIGYAELCMALSTSCMWYQKLGTFLLLRMQCTKVDSNCYLYNIHP